LRAKLILFATIKDKQRWIWLLATNALKNGMAVKATPKTTYKKKFPFGMNQKQTVNKS
jgi:hypothetical protein